MSVGRNSLLSVKLQPLLAALVFVSATLITSFSSVLILTPSNTSALSGPNDKGSCEKLGDTWEAGSESNRGKARCYGPATCAITGGVYNTLNNVCTSIQPDNNAKMGNMSLADRRSSYAYFRGVSNCTIKHIKDTISFNISVLEDNVDPVTHDWFGKKNETYFPYKENSITCNEIMKNAMDFWKVGSSGDFLRAMGYTVKLSDKQGGTAQWETGLKKSAVQKKLESFLGSKNIYTSLTDDVYYHALFRAFISDCNAGRMGAFSSLNVRQKDAVNEFIQYYNESQRNGGSTHHIPPGYAKIFTTARKVDAYKFTFGSDPAATQFTGLGSIVALFNYNDSLDSVQTPTSGRYPNFLGCTEIPEQLNSFVVSSIMQDLNQTCYKVSLTENNADGKAACRAGVQFKDKASFCTDAFTGKFVSDCKKGQGAVAQAAPDTTQDPDTDEDTDTGVSCSINGIGWAVCPILNFLASVTDGSFNFLSDNFLVTHSSIVAADDTNATYVGWKNMRNIANVLFIIAFLFIVFSQLTGVGVSNYGVKKLLPRIIIAAVLVNLSFFICQIAVDLSNILGYSLKDLFASMGTNSNFTASTSLSRTGNVWTGIVATVLALGTGAVIVYVFISALAPVLLGALVALVMILFILLARQALIILLVVLAPIAFVAFLLPNTQKWFTTWRKTFTALLIVFPIIAVVYGASGLASVILTSAFSAGSATFDTTGTSLTTDGAGRIWGQILGAAIASLPLLVVPSLLKKSLDGIGSLGGTLRGLGDKLQNRAKAGVANSGAMKSFKENRALGKARVGAGIYSGRNPVRKLQSSMNGRLNRSRAFNAVTGNYGTARGASIEGLESTAVKTAESAASLLAESGGPSIEAQLEEAITKGDTTRAKAAQNILMGKGGPGVESVRNILEKTHAAGAMSDTMRSSLSNNIMSNHAQTAKQKSADLLTWAKDGGMAVDPVTNQKSAVGTNAVAKSAGTWSKMTAAELAGLNDSAFQAALGSGGVSAATLEALRSERLSSTLSDSKRLTMASGYKAPAAQAAPTAQAVPAKDREFKREQIQAMGAENIQQAVDSRGGYESLNEGDLMSIRNAHGSSEVGQEARKELIRRGILTEQKPRDPGTMPKQ